MPTRSSLDKLRDAIGRRTAAPYTGGASEPPPREDTVEDGFSGREAADIVGITYRQLDYWARTDLIRPSLADARGSGSRRRYSYHDLTDRRGWAFGTLCPPPAPIELRMIKTLIDAGQKLERVRAAFEYLRDLGDAL